jgi:high-affinity iron transporter
MLATLVIGLREGLEASLIVGIIAAFLRRTGKPLRPMWIGVGIAIALSIAVGVILQAVSASLPQAQQEGMESIIGLVAVAVVTGMIGWMNLHARNMRSELEEHAALALRDGTAWALVGMAFLAVLKEGFETSVFLLAAFQSSTSFLGASAGAVLGIAIAVGVGIGIFRGGVHLNLSRFFRITGIFLVLVAAGLVLSSLRTAHEAGWVQIGQQTTINLAWLAPRGSVQAALLTGVLGIPADPRLIEVLGWFAYLVPTMLFLLWPVKRRPAGRALGTMRFGIAGVLVLAAVGLSVAVTLPSYSPPASASVVSTDGSVTTISMPTNSGAGISTTHEGISARLVRSTSTRATTGKPTTLTLDQLVTLNGGRLPIGVNASQNPGPFAASWLTNRVTSYWTHAGGILDAKRTSTTVLTLTGGGLTAARTISPDGAQMGSWKLSTATSDERVSRILSSQASSTELLLWKMWIPIVLALVALVLTVYALRSLFPRSPVPSRKKAKETYA